MKISPTYAHRNDLSPFKKWRFTLEEKVEQNKTVRAIYRSYFFSPSWAKEICRSSLLLFVIVPLFSMVLIEELLKKIVGKELGEHLCLPVFLIAIYVLTYFHFSGWILNAMMTVLLFVLWLTCLMEDYEEELEREPEQKQEM